MGKTFYSTNVLLAIILFLAVLLMLNTIYGCKYPRFMERFEDKVMSEESGEPLDVVDAKEIKENGDKPTEEDLKTIINKIKSDVTIKTDGEVPVAISKESTETKAPTSEQTQNLSPKETELFKAIVNDKMSTQDLEKLVKAGIVTENTIEKFLNEMDNSKKPLEGAEMGDSVIEGFSCGRDYATF